jgi:hypothetical protein
VSKSSAPGKSAAATPLVQLAPPVRKRPAWVYAGIALVGVAALIGAYVFNSLSDRITVVVAARDISPGEVIQATDLRAIELTRSLELRAVQAGQQELVLGLSARGPIPEGTVMNTGLVAARDAVVPDGKVVVGAALAPGALPVSNLAPGDLVEVLAVPPSVPGSDDVVATISIASGSIWSVESADDLSGSNERWISVLVDAELAPLVAQASADGSMRLILVQS